jgi:DNA-damage-inducible protein J
MYAEVKKQFDKFCRQVGMNTSTAINLFVREVLRNKRLPFVVTTESVPIRYDNNAAGQDDDILIPIRSGYSPL